MPTGGFVNWVDSQTFAQPWTTTTSSTAPMAWSTISSYAGTTSGYQQWLYTPGNITWNAADINLSAFEDLCQVGGLDTPSTVKDAREPTEEEFFDLLD